MARYIWVFPDKGTVTVYAKNGIDAKKEIKNILGRSPRIGRLVRR